MARFAENNMRVILGLAVMASVVFVASLKTTKTRKDERNLAALRSGVF